MKLKDLSVEYRKYPIGLDVNPRFSWKLMSEQYNTMQEAYLIEVTSKDDIVWNSGKVNSEESVLVTYVGNHLEPMTAYTVQVTVWDNHGNEAQIQGDFETGLLSQENFKGEWISHNFAKEETACPIFTKQIQIKANKVVRARMYATACGVYEVEVNGLKAGDAFLAPGWTSYHNRIQYQTYDITDLLNTGDNTISATVGNGWYKGYLNGEGENAFYGDQLAFLGMVYIEYEDGKKEFIGTDTDWSVSTGSIRKSELYMGEEQNFINPIKSNQSSEVVLFDAADKIKQIVSQESEPVRITQRIPAKRKFITPNDELVIDFGQNMAGLVEITLPELIGERLVVHHAEALDKNGNFYTENYRTATSVDSYIYGSEEVGKIVMPHFTYHGFRYIKLEGLDKNVDMNRFCACVLHTDMDHTGSFTGTNPLVNQLQSNIEWGQRSNYFDIPTDCPQRDERLGWTGDAQIFAATGSYNFNTALFFKKWMKDLAVESDEETGVPQLVPNIVGKTIGTSVWGDCATVIPWTVYQTYGDKQILIDQYDNMKLWVEFIRNNTGDDVLWMNGFQRGDWLSLDGDASLSLMAGNTDKQLVANVYYAYSTRILRDSCKILGKEEYDEYAELYEQIVEAINEEYVTSTGRIVSETQTACVLLLHFDLLTEKHKCRVIKTLEKNLMEHKGHLTTGFVGTAYLCQVLTDNGKHQLAENILLNEDYPGWLYSIKKGATTVWERWNSILPNGDFDQSGMNSLNHYTFGSIGDWLYRKIAGIDQLEAGYKKIQIKPHLTRTMAEVSANLDTVYGTVSYSQKCADNKIFIDIEIPANTTAVLKLPEQEKELAVGSGVYHYEYEIHTVLEAEKYSMNTTVGELMEDTYALHIINDTIPGFKDSTMLDFLRNKTLSELSAITPKNSEYFGKALGRINEFYIKEKIS